MQRIPAEVKVALIHATVDWKNKENNITRLLKLNEKAAGEGAKIILNPELATSGYSFDSRSDIAPFTETIPGPTTEKFGEISKKYGAYICFGLPEVDIKTGIFYNSAAVIGPEGKVIGKYRKISPAFKENLWAAPGNRSPLVFSTQYGKVGVVICADAYSYKPGRIAALQGARLLLVPVNWPSDYNNPEKYWRARALENGIYVLVCNRTGLDKSMDCRSGESFVINNQGEIVDKISSIDDVIIYNKLPLINGKFAAVAEQILPQRRPECYGNISLATFKHLRAEYLLDLPEAQDCTVAIIQYRPVTNDIKCNKNKMLELIDKSFIMAEIKKEKINLIVFPELSLTGNILDCQAAEELSEEIPGPTTKAFVDKAKEKNVFIVLGMAEKKDRKIFNSSVLISPDGVLGVYRKVHLTINDSQWADKGNEFLIFDLPFGRIGMLLSSDLMFPESTECLAKMGTDLLCVPSMWGTSNSKFIWEARLSEQMHIAIANQWGDTSDTVVLGESAIYSYSLDPDQRQTVKSLAENESINILRLNLKNTREKHFIENIDYEVLLDLKDNF